MTIEEAIRMTCQERWGEDYSHWSEQIEVDDILMSMGWDGCEQVTEEDLNDIRALVSDTPLDG